MKKTYLPCIFLFAEGYRTMTSGRVARDTVFQEIRPGVGFETGDFVKEKLGGLPSRSTVAPFLSFSSTKSPVSKTRSSRPYLLIHGVPRYPDVVNR